MRISLGATQKNCNTPLRRTYPACASAATIPALAARALALTLPPARAEPRAECGVGERPALLTSVTSRCARTGERIQGEGSYTVGDSLLADSMSEAKRPGVCSLALTWCGPALRFGQACAHKAGSERNALARQRGNGPRGTSE
eukprot:gnl/Chilomastix_cuspidata/1360.p4 GENE.gnl/Chilomastix_cuspidata/1360~~gnl/Chilomastix_cuspidata/1360.p4  ORF type:complete len:143 (+),score=8.21 gnl/Chilomastix_cuspidata/1360:186-614(+)